MAMGTFRLVVREHERIPIVVARMNDERALLPQEVAAMLRACRATDNAPFTVGHQSVKFNQQCGVIQAKSVCVEILPKVAEDDSFDRGLLLHMLACAAGFKIDCLGASKLRLQEHTTLQVLVQWFCTELSAQCHAGMLREYVSCSEELPTIRGRWRPDLDFRRGHRDPAKLSCEFDELVADNRYNRALKAALHSARALAAGSAPLIRQVDLLLGWFVDVADCHVSAADAAILPRNRLVARYERALRMAEWFLARRAPDLSQGEASGFAMLFDMNRLFQACLGRLLHRCLPQGLRLQEEGPRYHLSLDHAGERRFQMKPDFCIVAEGKVVAIIDAKWKRLTPDASNGTWGVQQADMYQLHAYATAYECPKVALWYPAYRHTENRAQRPIFQFLTAGTTPANAEVAIDWIDLFQALPGPNWAHAMIDDLASCLGRMGIDAMV